jgi:hypothetical protein
MQKTPIHPEVQALLRELFDADMTRKWGWGETFEPSPLPRAPLDPAVLARVVCGGLRMPYFGYSHLTVDPVARKVHCFATDQKTPAREDWCLTADPGWWQRAMQCQSWPVMPRKS